MVDVFYKLTQRSLYDSGEDLTLAQVMDLFRSGNSNITVQSLQEILASTSKPVTREQLIHWIIQNPGKIDEEKIHFSGFLKNPEIYKGDLHQPLYVQYIEDTTFQFIVLLATITSVIDKNADLDYTDKHGRNYFDHVQSLFKFRPTKIGEKKILISLMEMLNDLGARPKKNSYNLTINDFKSLLVKEEEEQVAQKKAEDRRKFHLNWEQERAQTWASYNLGPLGASSFRF